MHANELLRLEPTKLPIVDVDFMIQGLADPKIMRTLRGVRRQTIEKATQILQEAKRNQRDGHVELNNSDIALVLIGTATIVDWQSILLFNFNDDDEQI